MCIILVRTLRRFPRNQAYRDSVNEVRVGASEGLQRLCKVCGADWLQEKVLPRIHGFYDDSTFYLIRIAILNALKKLANGEVRVRLESFAIHSGDEEITVDTFVN